MFLGTSIIFVHKMVITLLYKSTLVMPTKKECHNKLSFMLLRKGGSKTIRGDVGRFAQLHKLFSGKPFLQFGAALFVFLFVIIFSLAALHAFFLTQRQKRIYFFQTHSPYSNRRPLDQVIFK